MAHEGRYKFFVEFFFAQDGAAECPALTIDVLRRGIDDNIRTQLQRPLQYWCGKDVVDDAPGAGSVCKFAYGGNIYDF